MRYPSAPAQLPLLAASRRGFTLIEMLTVIAVILMLTAILLPALNSAREQAQAVVCQDHERQLWQGFLEFAANHDNRLPGNENDRNPPYPDGTDWLGPNVPMWWDSWSTAPQDGTLFPYVNDNYAIYLCPSLQTDVLLGFDDGPGVGSNGRFDYVAFTTFAGCHLSRVPPRATFQYSDGATILLPTPIICEEEAWTLNGHNMEGNHASGDEMGHQHHGGGFYVSPDGAVNWFAEPWDCCADNWFVTSERGNQVCMGLSVNSQWFEQW